MIQILTAMISRYARRFCTTVQIRCKSKEVRKCMCGLLQAGLLAQELLEQWLAKHVYCQSEHTPCFWTHKTRPIQFYLVVDDFGVKYMGWEHAAHLKVVLGQHNDISTNWKGKKYDSPMVRSSSLNIWLCQKMLTRFQQKKPENCIINLTPYSPKVWTEVAICRSWRHITLAG